MAHSSFGLILPNRAIVLGSVSVRDLIDLTTAGEGSGAFDTIWVGDSLLAKPRLEAVTLLSTLAGVTTRARLGVGCMATFVHRHPVLLAHQWASLDVLSGGRSLLAVCLGGPDEASAAQAREHAAMSVSTWHLEAAPRALGFSPYGRRRKHPRVTRGAEANFTPTTAAGDA